MKKPWRIELRNDEQTIEPRNHEWKTKNDGAVYRGLNLACKPVFLIIIIIIIIIITMEDKRICNYEENLSGLKNIQLILALILSILNIPKILKNPQKIPINLKKIPKHPKSH